MVIEEHDQHMKRITIQINTLIRKMMTEKQNWYETISKESGH